MLLILLACDANLTTDKVQSDPGHDSGISDSADTDSGDSAGETDDTDTGTAADGCRATPAAADRDRAVFVSLPYGSSGRAADVWARLTLTESGDLVDDGFRFEMGRSYMGEIEFTPDGEIGFAVQDDGTLGIFHADGTVINPGVGGFYAGRVVVDPSGEFVWVVDGNWQNNGGGIYRLPIDCETGEPGTPERVVEAKLPADILLEGDQAVIVGREVPGSDDSDDLSRVSWPDGTFVLGTDAFGDDDAFVTDAVRWDDLILIGDNSEFSGVPTRVAVVAASDLKARGTFDVEDPISLIHAGGIVLIVSGYGDAVLGVKPDSDGNVSSVFTVVNSELPGGAARVGRGSLEGRVLVSEVSGIHMVDIDDEGNSSELGVTSLGTNYEGIIGAIGIAP